MAIEKLPFDPGQLIVGSFSTETIQKLVEANGSPFIAFNTDILKLLLWDGVFLKEFSFTEV